VSNFLSNLFKNGVNPKWMIVLVGLIDIQKGIGAGAVSLTNMVPDSWIPHIVAWNTGLAWIGIQLVGVLAALSSNSSGPLVSNISLPSIDIPKTVAKVLIFAFALSFLLAAHSAQAAERREFHPAVTGNIPNDIATDLKGGVPAGTKPSIGGVTLTGDMKTDALAVWKQIQSASHDDLAYASLMAGAAGTPASKTRKQCWDAIVQVNEQSNGNNLKNADGTPATKPNPSMFTDIETAAEIVDNLSPQGTLYTSCAGAAQLFQANVIQFISAAVTGVTGLAKLAPIPGL
jgi:hypothetical protein